MKCDRGVGPDCQIGTLSTKMILRGKRMLASLEFFTAAFWRILEGAFTQPHTCGVTAGCTLAPRTLSKAQSISRARESPKRTPESITPSDCGHELDADGSLRSSNGDGYGGSESLVTFLRKGEGSGPLTSMMLNFCL